METLERDALPTQQRRRLNFWASIFVWIYAAEEIPLDCIYFRILSWFSLLCLNQIGCWFFLDLGSSISVAVYLLGFDCRLTDGGVQAQSSSDFLLFLWILVFVGGIFSLWVFGVCSLSMMSGSQGCWRGRPPNLAFALSLDLSMLGPPGSNDRVSCKSHINPRQCKPLEARIFICTGTGRLEANLQLADYLPEHVIVRILWRLPIKSLIRFTCVSKQWRFIILSDPEFAKSQFQISSEQQTFHRRVLVHSPSDGDVFESLDLEAPSSSSVRKVSCPFKQPGRPVRILCSCNGMVFAVLYSQENNMYIWNPSTGFFKKLPYPAAVPSKTQCLRCYGFGYLSATDDYKLLAKLVATSADDYVDVVDSDDGDDEGEGNETHIFSSKANIWKRIEAPLNSNFEHKGTLSNEALHWLDDLGILAFDLSNEEFRRMPLPIFDYRYDGEYSRHLGAFGDCLCAFDPANFIGGSIDLWVMREYDVADSWTKLFNLRVSNQPEKIFCWRPILVMETSTFLEKWALSSDGRMVFDFIRSSHTAEKSETQIVRRNTRMIDFEESLRWLAAP